MPSNLLQKSSSIGTTAVTPHLFPIEIMIFFIPSNQNYKKMREINAIAGHLTILLLHSSTINFKKPKAHFL